MSRSNPNTTYRSTWMMVIALLSLQGTLDAQKPTAILQQAKQDYLQGKYTQAVLAYESLIAAGYDDPGLCFNLGNACSRAGKMGKAVLYYEKALASKPNDEAVLTNLELVRGELTDQIDHSSAPEWWNWLIQPQWILRPNTWAILFAILIWTGMGIVWVLRRQASRPWLRWAAQGILALAIVALLGAILSFWNSHENPAGIILSKETTLRIGPEKASPAIRTLHEGTKVAYLDKIGTWDKVRLSNGQEGWLEGNATQAIR
jgi:tetratricopeptide (TPR) repeat protein